jgi:MSHA biogenesis protein MshO
MPLRRQRGFSLVEIVAAIVIMAIMAIGLVDFITNSAIGYSQTAARNQVSSAGRVVIDRIAMELHNALPASVRISTPLAVTDANGYAGDQCIEFIAVQAASTYLNPAFRPQQYKAAFDAVDFVPSQLGENGIYAVIYPTTAADLYDADFGPADATEAIARVNVTDGVTAFTDTLTYSRLSDDAPYNHRFLRRSSVERIFLTGQPVSYCITGTKLYRYADYGFSAVQLLPERPNGAGCAAMTCLPATTPKRALLTDQLDNSALTGGGNQAFDQLDASRRRNAVIQLELNFSQDGQEVLLNHEVLLQATP